MTDGILVEPFPVVDLDDNDLSEDLWEAAKVAAQEFFEKVCSAARKDGQAFDPPWRDLAVLAQEHDEGASAYYTSKVQVTCSAENDTQLYRLFRAQFPNFEAESVQKESFEDDEPWRSLAKAIKENDNVTIDEPTRPALLRQNALYMLAMEEDGKIASAGLMVVPNFLFVIVELCRVREGIYGRNFRLALELFDLYTQGERLGGSAFDSSQETSAIDALYLLRIQWPHPSPSALQSTKLVPLLERVVKEGCSSGVRAWGKKLWDRWTQVENQPAPQMAREALMDDHEDGDKQHMSLPPSTNEASPKTLAVEPVDAKQPRPEESTEEEPIGPIDGTVEKKEENAHESLASVSSNHSTGMQVEPENDIPSMQLPVNGDLRSGLVTTTFRRDGIVALRGMMTDLEEYKKQAKEALDALAEEQLEPRGLELDSDEAFELWDAKRGPGRRLENQFRILDDPDSPIAMLSRRLQTELPSLLFNDKSDDFRLDRAGVLHCFPMKNDDRLPGTEAWTREGSSLFHDNHHDAYSLYVLIPLSDILDGSGILEFIPGTQIDTFHEVAAAEIAQLGDAPSAQHDKALQAQWSAGTIVVLDNRVLKRGLRNSSAETKQMLYFSYTRHWFRPTRAPTFFQMNKSSTEALAIHSKLLLMSRLHQLVTGIASTHLVSISDFYGNKFFTDRFDLLLLEGLLSDDDGSKASATANIAAILLQTI
jgi:hypothetical protein